MQIYRAIVLFVCLSVVCFLGSLCALLRWGDLNLVRDFARLNGWIGLKLARIRLRIAGLEHLEAHQPCIYVVNHQHALDVWTVGLNFPKKTGVIGKKELRWIPFFGMFFAASGNIMIDRKNRTQSVGGLAEAVKALRERGSSIMIFPEGTRNRSDQAMLPFKKGAFRMAVDAQVPIVPIVTSSIRRSFATGRTDVRVLPPISTRGMTEADTARIMEDVRGKMIEAFRSLESSSMKPV